MSNTHETTSLKTKVFESSLEWNIEKFNEFSKRDLGSITSRRVQIEGTDVSWILHVHPNGYHSSTSYDDSFVSLSLQINCENPSRHHSFNVEVKTAGVGHQLLSPHADDESEYSAEYITEYVAAPRDVKPIFWNIKYENINKRQHFELCKEDFIKGQELSKYIFDGSLRLLTNVTTTSVEIEDEAVETDGNHKFF